MFTWRYLSEEGGPSGSSEAFPERDAAEAWLGDAWEELLEAGIERVELVDGSNRVLYRMGLRPR